jgi:divalent metal cation (Fe/Co/Zn/Cd) transporter
MTRKKLSKIAKLKNSIQRSLVRPLAIIQTPMLLAVGTIISAVFALVFAFTAHGIFMLDIVAGLIIKSFIIHKAVRGAKRKRTTRKARSKHALVVSPEMAE